MSSSGSTVFGGGSILSGINWEKDNIRRNLLRKGTENVDDPKPPKDDVPTPKSSLVRGVTKSARAANRQDWDEVRRLKKRLNGWLKVGDVSQLEIDKLVRKIKALEARLPPEEKVHHSEPNKNKNKRKKRKRKRLYRAYPKTRNLP